VQKYIVSDESTHDLEKHRLIDALSSLRLLTGLGQLAVTVQEPVKPLDEETGI
jgi:hypothetical protein